MESIDGLFLSYFEDIDLWHNDPLPGDPRPAARGNARPSEDDLTMRARTMRQSVSIDGNLYDLSRFLSWARYGTTAHYRRYDAFSCTHLSGSYYRSLAARHGYDVRHINQADRIVVERLAQRFTPRYLFLSTTFQTETSVILDAVQCLRRAFPGVPLVLGGLILVELERGCTADTFQRFLRAWRADAYVVSAQGEEAFLEFLRHDPSELCTLDLPATWMRQGASYVRSARAEVGLSIDREYVRWSAFDPSSLHAVVHARTARSCAFECAFCSYPANQGPLVLEDLATLEREMEELTSVSGPRALVFVDDTFNVPQKRFRALLDVLARFRVPWFSFYRCQFADRETVEKMAESGCKGVFLGLESIDDTVLKNMNKAATAAAYRRGIAELSRAGIPMHANFIIGYPGDRAENAQRAADFVDETGVEFVNATPFFCSPATPVGRSPMRERFGIEGNFWKWRHDSMTSAEAFVLELEFMELPQRSAYLSELSARTFWTELLHYAQGWTPAELQEVTRTYYSLCGRDHAATVLAQTPQVARLRMLLDRHPMCAPPEPELAGVPVDPSIRVR